MNNKLITCLVESSGNARLEVEHAVIFNLITWRCTYFGKPDDLLPLSSHYWSWMKQPNYTLVTDDLLTWQLTEWTRQHIKEQKAGRKTPRPT